MAMNVQKRDVYLSNQVEEVASLLSSILRLLTFVILHAELLIALWVLS